MFTDLRARPNSTMRSATPPLTTSFATIFAFLSDRVQRNHGFVVKTVGDAVMAAFSRPDHAVRAALAIQDDVASFNSARGEARARRPSC